MEIADRILEVASFGVYASMYNLLDIRRVAWSGFNFDIYCKLATCPYMLFPGCFKRAFYVV